MCACDDTSICAKLAGRQLREAGWHAWRSVEGKPQARRPRTSPPVFVRADDVPGLRAAMRKQEERLAARHRAGSPPDGVPSHWAAVPPQPPSSRGPALPPGRAPAHPPLWRVLRTFA